MATGYNPFAGADTTTAGGGTSGDNFGLGSLINQQIVTKVARPTPNSPNMTPEQRDALNAQGSLSTNEGSTGKSPEPIVHSAGAEDFMQQVASLAATDPQTLANYQIQMWKSGLYGNVDLSDISLGHWTTDTASAFKKVLSGYKQADALGGLTSQQKSVFDYLGDLSGTPVGKAAKDLAGPAPVTTVNNFTDPNSVSAAAQSAAQSALGRNLSDKEIEKFVTEFHAVQANYNKTYNSAQQDTKGGTFNLTQPDLSSQAQAFAQSSNPNEAAANKASDYVVALQQMLGVT